MFASTCNVIQPKGRCRPTLHQSLAFTRTQNVIQPKGRSWPAPHTLSLQSIQRVYVTANLEIFVPIKSNISKNAECLPAPVMSSSPKEGAGQHSIKASHLPEPKMLSSRKEGAGQHPTSHEACRQFTIH